MRFNLKARRGAVIENLAGGQAYAESPKLELVSLLLTSFAANQYYRCADQSVDRLRELIAGIDDKKFTAKAAIYAREKFGMRSITHASAGEIANSVKGVEWTRPFFERIVYRVDDITEILAYYLNAYGKPVPNSLKDGLGRAFGKFDGYQLAKYRAEGAKVSLVDAVNLLKPVPNERNADALRKLILGELKSIGTWESELTRAGQTAESDEEKAELKAEAWRSLISERKIGYFALLRNLRNVIEQAPDMTGAACELLVDERLIRKSLVLPFRFTTAMDEIQKLSGPEASTVVSALNKAIDISLANVPKLSGKTLVVVDRSGSMMGRPLEIASLFGAVLAKTNAADLILFSDKAQYFTVNMNDSASTTAELIRKRYRFGGGTNFHSIFGTADRKYDRIIILSDMQGWMGYTTPANSFKEYRKRTGADPVVYSFDLAGYGTLQFPERNVFALAGFSEKVFDIMALLETDRNALVSEIEKVEL